jgi:hypothetical protein
MFDGVKKTIGDKEYIIPALSLKQVQDLKDTITHLRLDDYSGMAKIIHAAMSRNYPQITLKEVTEILDMNNILDITEAVCNFSGLKKKMMEMAGNGLTGV